jgi:putative endonuclease
MKNKKHNAYYFGFFVEVFAVIYLRLKFYSIIARRFKSPFGEIDIIAKKNNQLIFVEIKARHNTSLMDFISNRQQNRITKAAQYFLLKYSKYQSYNIRFDAIIMNRYFWPKHFKSYW